MSTRRFEMVDGTAKKFWEIELEGTRLSIRWGRIGTAGQAQEKPLASETAARKELERLIAEKTKKGYEEVGTAVTDPPPRAASATTLGASASLQRLRGELDPGALARAIEALDPDAVAIPEVADAVLAALAAHEVRHGITEAHRTASARFRDGLTLMHPFAHESNISGAAISASGRWLATGSPFVDAEGGGSEHAYERGGLVCIWDVRAGRCVNVLGRVTGGVGGIEGSPRSLEWHGNERALAAATGTHGVVRLSAFASDGGLGCVTTQGDGFDGIAPAWCWIPGGDDLALATYVVTMGEEGRKAKLRKAIEEVDDDDDGIECDFRNRVCAYDGVITDGHYTISATTLARVDARPFRDPRMGRALAGLSVDEAGPQQRVRFTSPSGAGITLDVTPRRFDEESAFVPVSASPDGHQIAVLAVDGTVLRFSDDGTKLGEIAAAWAHGVAFGDGVLVLLAPERIAFVEIATGATLGDFAQGQELSPHPLGDGALVEKAFRFDPAFAMPGGWAVALPTGEVAAPPEVCGALDGVLALALGRRRAWPLHWAVGTPAAPRIATGVGDLASALPTSLRKSAAKAAAPKKPAKRSAFEVRPLTVVEVFDDVVAGIDAAPEKWKPWHTLELAGLEARHGNPHRAVAVFRAALERDDDGPSMTPFAAAARAMAERGQALAGVAREMITIAEAIPEARFLRPVDRAAMQIPLALAYEALGDTARAHALVDEAIAQVPEWTTIPDSPHAPLVTEGDAAALAAGVLLRRGKREQAFQVLRAIRAPFGVQPLFRDAAAAGDHELTMVIAETHRNVTHPHATAARAALAAGHLDIFDALVAALAPSPYSDKEDVARLGITRWIRGAQSNAGDDDMIAGIQATLDAESQPSPRVAAWATAIDVCREAGRREPARVLAERLMATTIELPPARSYLRWHGAVAAARAGADIRPLVARTDAAADRLALACALLEDGIETPIAVELALSIDVAKLTEGNAEAAALAARGLARVGQHERAAACFDAAVTAAGSSRFVLTKVATVQAEAEQYEAAWSTVQRAKKSERPNVVADFAAAMAYRGRADVLGAIFRAAGFADPLPILTGLRAWNPVE